MPLARRILPESSSIVGVPRRQGRPLFVPPGLRQVRTGPTSRAELDRLLADADDLAELSGIRVREGKAAGLLQRVLSVLGLRRAS